MVNYNIVQKILHNLIFKFKIINISLYVIEKKLYLNQKIKIKDNNHIFISGLPRSGTTSLLNFIYLSNEFASLKYSNMPFLLSPNLLKFFNNSKIEKKERLHSDGIYVDLSSPESFDEVFFHLFQEKTREELVNYLNLILKSENKLRYLSKNNLNFKRIEVISSILPNSKFLIPIRDPFQTAFSLLNQNSKFCDIQIKDNFIRRYMNYLGHKEFGLDHKSWYKSINFFDRKDINYWLEQWYLFYSEIYLRFKPNKNCFFVIYENLDKKEYVEKLCKYINVNYDNCNKQYFRIFNRKIKKDFDNNLSDKSLELYKKFKILNTIN